MQVLLLKDVHGLGHAGDVKKVTDGYARNYLIPRKLAVTATAEAMKQANSTGRRSAANRLRSSPRRRPLPRSSTG